MVRLGARQKIEKKYDLRNIQMYMPNMVHLEESEPNTIYNAQAAIIGSLKLAASCALFVFVYVFIYV